MARDVVAGHRLASAEADLLRVLLAAPEPLLIAELQERLGDERWAHTTIATLLSRLRDRGLVVREPRGRGHAYAAAGTDEELAVMALERVVAELQDPAGTLAAFLDGLPSPTRRRIMAKIARGRGR